jgi:hypothetical protein
MRYFRAVGIRHAAAGEHVFHGSTRFRVAFGLHGYSLDQTAVRIGNAEGTGQGAAGQGEDQGGGKSQFFIPLDTRPGAMFCTDFAKRIVASALHQTSHTLACGDLLIRRALPWTLPF